VGWVYYGNGIGYTRGVLATRPKANTPTAFVAIMRLLREESGLSETRYAIEMLGISSATWSHVVVTQIRGAGGTFLAAVFRRYPELIGLIGRAHAGHLEGLTEMQLRQLIDNCRPGAGQETARPYQGTTLVTPTPVAAD
jgi:hypothetical protein